MNLKKTLSYSSLFVVIILIIIFGVTYMDSNSSNDYSSIDEVGAFHANNTDFAFSSVSAGVEYGYEGFENINGNLRQKLSESIVKSQVKEVLKISDDAKEFASLSFTDNNGILTNVNIWTKDDKFYMTVPVGLGAFEGKSYEFEKDKPLIKELTNLFNSNF